MENMAVTKKTRTRIAALIDASGKTHKSIANAIEVHENSLARYYSGERDMGLETAARLAKALNIDPALIFNDRPIRPIMTGIAAIDRMLLDLTDAIMNEDCANGIDAAAHYFSDTFLCASPEYTYGGAPTEREGDSGNVASDVQNYKWTKLQIDKNIQLRGVTRAQEFDSYMKRRKSGHVASFEYIFAHLVDKYTICFLIQSTWSIIDTKLAPTNTAQWKIRESYRSIDHLIFRNSISQVLYDGAALVVERKLWHPMGGHFRPI